MKKAKLIFVCLVFIAAAVLIHAFRKGGTERFKSGDIIFIVNPSGQGKAIQLATKSVYTHVGVIFREGEQVYVYHAVQPVSKSKFRDFLTLSADGGYVVKRLKNATAVLDSVKLDAMKKEAASLLGLNYDIYFDWSDKEYYCSEFVWKLFKHNCNVEVGRLRPLKEFDLTSAPVKKKMEERYGAAIPLDSKMISPGDMFDSDLLELVARKP